MKVWDIRKGSRNFLHSLSITDQSNASEFPSSSPMRQKRQRNDQISNKSAARHIHDHGVVNGLLYSDDGLCLFVAGQGCELQGWDADFGKLIHSLPTHVASFGTASVQQSARKLKMAVTTSNRNQWPIVIFFPCDDEILLVDVKSKSVLKQLQGHYSSINCIVHNPQRNVFPL